MDDRAAQARTSEAVHPTRPVGQQVDGGAHRHRLERDQHQAGRWLVEQDVQHFMAARIGLQFGQEVADDRLCLGAAARDRIGAKQFGDQRDLA